MLLIVRYPRNNLLSRTYVYGAELIPRLPDSSRIQRYLELISPIPHAELLRVYGQTERYGYRTDDCE